MYKLLIMLVHISNEIMMLADINKRAIRVCKKPHNIKDNNIIVEATKTRVAKILSLLVGIEPPPFSDTSIITKSSANINQIILKESFK